MAKQSIRLSDHFTYGKLLRFTLPSICMMVFTSIYGVVDGLFVSNFVGKTPFAAVNLVMPFVMILGGMGFMIGTGGTALVSKLLGEGKQDEAHRTFSMLVLFTLLLGAVLSAVGILTMPAVARLLVVPTGRLQHLCLRLLYRPEQRCRLRCHLLPADAGVPSRLRRRPAHTSGRGRYLVGHHRRRDLCLYHLRRLSGAQAE